jgi:hypothetical protein
MVIALGMLVMKTRKLLFLLRKNLCLTDLYALGY